MNENLKNQDPSSATSIASSDILTKIIEKERELEMNILSAQEEANTIIQKAREEAAEIIENQKKEAEKEAAAAKEDILDKARQEAKKIRADSAKMVKDVGNVPKELMEKTISHLLEMVLPGEKKEGGSR